MKKMYILSGVIGASLFTISALFTSQLGTKGIKKTVSRAAKQAEKKITEWYKEASKKLEEPAKTIDIKKLNEQRESIITDLYNKVLNTKKKIPNLDSDKIYLKALIYINRLYMVGEREIRNR